MLGESINDGAIAAAASKVAVGGGTAAWVGWLASSEFIALSGLAVGMIGLAVQVFFRARDDRRSAEYHAARMEDLRRR